MGGKSTKQAIEYSRPVWRDSISGQSPLFRHPDASVSLEASTNCTLFDSFHESVEKYRENPFLGTRALTSSKTKEYRWKTYRQVYEDAIAIGKGIRSLNIPPSDDNLTLFGILSRNREEWVICDIACMSQNITSVAIYDTQNSDNVKHIIEQVGLTAIACSANKLSMIFKLKTDGSIPTLKKILVFEETHRDEIRSGVEVGLELLTFKQAKETKSDLALNAANPNSVYTISYTCGSNDFSKGVVITHSMMMASVSGLICSDLDLNSSDSYLSYLPLGHIMERVALHISISNGGKIGFYSGDISRLKDDLIALKPTVFLSFPRLYHRFYDIINHQLSTLGKIKRSIVLSTINRKMKKQSKGNYRKLTLEKYYLKSFRNLLGGKVRLLITAGGHISPSIFKFLRAVFGVPFAEVYGLTECSGGVFYTKPCDVDIQHVGGPLINIEFKFLDVPELGYFSSDVDSEGRIAPRGEILVRGPAVFRGYYKVNDSSEVDAEGWLHTGDIGLRLPHNGAVQIIDRKRNMIQLSTGHSIPLEKIENLYLGSCFVTQILAYGDSNASYLVAIVVPSEAYVRKVWDRSGSYVSLSFSELCRQPKLNEDILLDLNRVARENSLCSYQEVKKIYLESTPWTIDDYFSPTFMLKRQVAYRQYAEALSSLYKSSE
jgi:long-chain acyl-CoA synthetase